MCEACGMPFNDDGPEWEFLRKFEYLDADEQAIAMLSCGDGWEEWEIRVSRFWVMDGKLMMQDCVRGVM